MSIFAPQSAPQEAAVQLSNISLSIDGIQRLSGVTHTLPRAGITALVGANGAGKSLLLRTLHGLVRPDTGKIRWADALSGDRRALMRQQPQFLRRSLRENLAFALKAAGWRRTAALERADQTLEWVQMGDVADRRATDLSPGLQARLAMARALAVEPGVLLLDEPTASLDPAATLALEELIGFAAEAGTKVILVSHSLGQVRRLATDVLLLDAGKSVFYGPTDLFFAGPSHPKARAFLQAAGFLGDTPQE